MSVAKVEIAYAITSKYNILKNGTSPILLLEIVDLSFDFRWITEIFKLKFPKNSSFFIQIKKYKLIHRPRCEHIVSFNCCEKVIKNILILD